MAKTTAILIILIGLYLGLFWQSERQRRDFEPRLSLALPVPVQRIAAGCLKDLAAEVLFVKTAVFLGIPLPIPEEHYADTLHQNFQVMTELYPEFRDPYYLCQSSLAHISPAYAGMVNEILGRGIETYPDDIILPFFAGFNYFYYMHENKKAAEIFSELAQRPEGPKWLGHLSATLSAAGGDLYGSLMTLRAMYATEQDEEVRERYAREINMFERAIRVFEATRAFEAKNGRYPQRLGELVPDFLPSLPDFDGQFELVWVPPNLHLERPQFREKTKKR